MSVHRLTIPSPKGGISAVVHYPETQTDKLAILCPGYLDTKEYKHLIGLAQELCEAGFTVVRFDPTGTWESGGDVSEYTPTQYLEDIKNVLEAMLEEHPYKTILLSGHSLGGWTSMLYAARDPRISIVLAMMSPHTPRLDDRLANEWKEAGFRISQRDVPGSTEMRAFSVPYAHQVDRDRFDLLADVQKIHAPIILVAGELDTKVLPEAVQEIYRNANEPKKFILLKNIDHDYRHNDKEVKIVNAAVMEQLDALM